MKLTYNPKFSALLISSLAIGQSALMAQTAQKAPNILFICIDDLRPQLGAYGYEYMKTPNLDAIAAEGRVFSEHYVQVPTSGASRASMLTGKYPTTKKDMSNETYWNSIVGKRESAQPESFIHHFKRNGYYTVGLGKISHHGNGHIITNGCEALELPYSWDRYVNDPDWLWKRDDILHAYADGGARIKEPKPAFESPDLPDESFPDGRLAKMAVSELELISKREGDEPFLMAVGFYKPHLPFCAPLKYWNMYEGVDIPLAPQKEIPQGVDKAFVYESLEFKNQYSHPHRAGAGVVIPDDYAKDVIRAYYAAISYTDAQVGKVMTKLKELGLDKNTIVVVWGDHGWSLGDHTIWGKHSTFNRALNSAFMIKTPNMKSAGVATDELIESVDIYPTICELAGISTPEGVDGKSIIPILEDPKATVHNEVYSYWLDMITVKNKEYRLSIFDDNKGKREVMLFDHKKDPNETVNIAEKRKKVVAELTEKLKSQTKDFLPSLK